MMLRLTQEILSLGYQGSLIKVFLLFDEYVGHLIISWEP